MVDAKEFAAAIWRGDAAAVDAMIAAGADVNAVAPEGFFTPLHLAVEQMYVDIARRLIEAGADINFDLGEGLTPLVHAIDIESDAAWQRTYQRGQETTELSEMLLGAGAVITDRAMEAAENYDNEKARMLLRGYAQRG